MYTQLCLFKLLRQIPITLIKCTTFHIIETTLCHTLCNTNIHRINATSSCRSIHLDIKARITQHPSRQSSYYTSRKPLKISNCYEIVSIKSCEYYMLYIKYVPRPQIKRPICEAILLKYFAISTV